VSRAAYSYAYVPLWEPITHCNPPSGGRKDGIKRIFFGSESLEMRHAAEAGRRGFIGNENHVGTYVV